MKVDINSIKPSPYQPRLVFEIDELRQEIERDGLLSDLVVRKQGEGYELIDGERRLRALNALGWKTVPIRVVTLDDKIVRRSVYKVNKIRQDYTVEEEARYFKQLTDEGLTPWQISKELSVDFHWILAHLNAFKFPKYIQTALWNGQISISHLVALENVIGRSVKEAKAIIKEIISRKLTLKETKGIIQKQQEKVEKIRIEAAKEVLPKIAPKVRKLKTAKDFERAAKALKKVAKRKQEEALSPEKKAALDAKKRRTAEALKRKKKEKQRLDELRIAEEAKKLAERFKEKERRRIEQRVKKEMEKTSIAKLRKSLTNLKHKMKELQKAKASLLDKRAFLLEALNFNCPHCKSACVIYREGESYLVKRSATVSIAPGGPETPSPPAAITSKTAH